MSFTLKDKDVGDSFLVKVKPDMAYGTPMFELLAGESVGHRVGLGAG